MDIAGLESLAGGRTGHPYSGPDGAKRFAKMKENVVREWEEQERRKVGEVKGDADAAGGAEKDAGAGEKEGGAGAGKSRLGAWRARLLGRSA